MPSPDLRLITAHAGMVTASVVGYDLLMPKRLGLYRQALIYQIRHLPRRRRVPWAVITFLIQRNIRDSVPQARESELAKA